MTNYNQVSAQAQVQDWLDLTQTQLLFFFFPFKEIKKKKSKFLDAESGKYLVHASSSMMGPFGLAGKMEGPTKVMVL